MCTLVDCHHTLTFVSDMQHMHQVLQYVLVLRSRLAEFVVAVLALDPLVLVEEHGN